MNAVEILKAMSEHDELADEVLGFLNHGMNDEWDCSLPQGLLVGFGGVELRIAARSGLALAEAEQGKREAVEGTCVEVVCTCPASVQEQGRHSHGCPVRADG